MTQESYSADSRDSTAEKRLPERTSDATSLIRLCEAWATEAFRLPADFLQMLAAGQGGKRSKR